MKAVITKIQPIAAAVNLPREKERPILILTIANGAAHTQAAETIAEAWREINSVVPVQVVEVSRFMSPTARFTHVSAYLWLVKNAPQVWGKIDRYQKRQTSTSPEWFYRRGCRKLFDFVREIKPAAIVATEVGCCEIAALIKKDLLLDAPLVAVNLDLEADRAWVQPAVDLYCVATIAVKKDLINFGVAPHKIEVWGVPLKPDFKFFNEEARAEIRRETCKTLNLDSGLPIVLIAGGGEGLGKIEEIVKAFINSKTQIVALCGTNARLKNSCEKLAQTCSNLCVLGWTENVSRLFQSADVLISKLGLTFYEATACGLPIVALEPLPGAERVQYKMLAQSGIGRAVKNLEEMKQAAIEILNDKKLADRMRCNMRNFSRANAAAPDIAEWLDKKIYQTVSQV